MTDKPVAKTDVHAALFKAIDLMDKKIGPGVTRPKLDSFIINGRWLRELALAKTFADGVAKGAGVHTTVVHLEAGGYIAGFVAQDQLASLKPQAG